LHWAKPLMHKLELVTANAAPTRWYWRLLLISLRNTSRPVIWGSLWNFYILNPLHCFSCQKLCYMCEMWGSWPCRSQLQQSGTVHKLQGKHAASLRKCQIETRKTGATDKGGARYLVSWCQKGCPFSAINEYLSSKRTAASVISGTTTVTSHCSQKPVVSTAIQTELTWPQCQSKPLVSQRKPIAVRILQKNRNTTSPSPPPNTNRGAQ